VCAVVDAGGSRATLTDEPRFSLELTVPAEGDALVTVSGELDMFRAPAFEALLRRSIDEGARQIVVDLGAVDFIDSTGLGVIVSAAVRLRQVEGSLTVVYGDAQVRRIFEMTALDSIVGLYQARRYDPSRLPR
jgi:anti-sigma B factor antagonist